ncbi:hypothetical protein JQC91_00515 [Jannaschia sp. Os4]|uniref:hypothetical protein n=1 Tax=Jannaschia sp. Os4 TaxID=2807617 RepID=UPI00193A8EF6|nr:hypothetical protein [Jannaschia sp. Os4]MBM2574773.1 hypothetical protein [Jannaschia sp. Os4]
MPRFLLIATAALALGACSAGDIAKNTGDAAVVTTRAAVQAGVGAGKLVWKGGKWVASGSSE